MRRLRCSPIAGPTWKRRVGLSIGLTCAFGSLGVAGVGVSLTTAPAAPCTPQSCSAPPTLEYKGTIDAWTAEGFVGNGTPDTLDPAGRWDTRIQWDAVATLTPGVTPIWQFKTLTGTTSLTSPIAPGTPCSATFTANPAYQLPVNLSTLAGGAQQVSQRIADVASVSYSPTQAGALLPSAKCVPDAQRSAQNAFPIDYAANNFQAFAPTQFAALQQAQTVTAQFQPGGTTTATSSFNQPALMRPSITGPTDGLTITQSITATAGTCPTGGASTGMSAAAATQRATPSAAPAACQVTIVDANTKTAPHARVWVGQPIKLTATCPCGPVTGLTWDVQDSRPRPAAANYSAVADYQITDTSASLTPLTQFIDQNLSLRFMRPGTYTINVTTNQGTAQPLTMNVLVPAVTSSTRINCSVDIDHIKLLSRVNHTWTTPPSLSFGYNDSCGRTPGISLTFTASADRFSGGAGEMRMTQLFTKTVTHGFVTCANSVSTSPANPLGPADLASFWNHDTKANVPGTWFGSDSPLQGLPGKVLTPASILSPWAETFRATDFVMYKNSATGSAWVPIGTLTWGWSGTAQAVWNKHERKLDWILAPGATRNLSAYGPLGLTPDAVPTWSNAVGPAGAGAACDGIL